MAKPSAEVLAWVGHAVGSGRRVVVGPDLPQAGDGGPWLLELQAGDSVVRAVLRVDDPSDVVAVGRFATEAAALGVAEEHGLAAPRLWATDLDGKATGTLALVESAVAGSSCIPVDHGGARLRRLGRAMGAIHQVMLTPTLALPMRVRSLEGVDFAGLGLSSDASADLLGAARRLVAEGEWTKDPPAFVHGDFWQGNTLWRGPEHTGTVDWDFAGVGPAGIDLGSARCDVAVMYGPSAADEVVAGWEEMHGSPAANVAWWDVVAAVCTPPDLAMWLPNFHQQGRRDLDLATVTSRRHAFLEAALRQIG